MRPIIATVRRNIFTFLYDDTTMGGKKYCKFHLIGVASDCIFILSSHYMYRF